MRLTFCSLRFSVPSHGVPATARASEPSTTVPSAADAASVDRPQSPQITSLSCVSSLEGHLGKMPSGGPSLAATLEHATLEQAGSVSASGDATSPGASWGKSPRKKPPPDLDTAAIEADMAAKEEPKDKPQDKPKEAAGGLRGFFADVLFGEEEDDADEEEDLFVERFVAPREFRRSLAVSVCMPILACHLEQSRLQDFGREVSSASALPGPREMSWVCTLSLLGLSAFAMVPPKNEELPLEGSVELHHVALQTPGAEAGDAPEASLSWGSPLQRSPLEADEAVPYDATSLERARAWEHAVRRILAPGVEYPHPSHVMIGGSAPPPPEAASAAGQAAVRVGLLVISPPGGGGGAEGEEDDGAAVSRTRSRSDSGEAVQQEINRFSVQLAEVDLKLEATWWMAVRDMLSPLGAIAGSAPPGHPGHPAGRQHLPSSPSRLSSSPSRLPSSPSRRMSSPSGEWTPGGQAAPKPPVRQVVEAVVCFAGLRASLGPFAAQLGSVRADYRQAPHKLDDASLASALSETTVFISSVFAHMPRRGRGSTPRPGTEPEEEEEGSLLLLRLSTAALRYWQPADGGAAAPPVLTQLFGLQELFCAVVSPDATHLSGDAPASSHLEASFAQVSCSLSRRPARAMLGCAEAFLGLPAKAGPGPGAREDGGDSRALTVEVTNMHWALATTRYLAAEPVATGSLRPVSRRGASPSRHRGGDTASSSSDADSNDSPDVRPLPGARRPGGADRALCTQQLLLFVRRLGVTFTDGRGGSCDIVKPYDFRPHTSLCQAASRAAGMALPGMTPPDATLSLVCQTCPAALAMAVPVTPIYLHATSPPTTLPFKNTRQRKTHVSIQMRCLTLTICSPRRGSPACTPRSRRTSTSSCRRPRGPSAWSCCGGRGSAVACGFTPCTSRWTPAGSTSPSTLCPPAAARVAVARVRRRLRDRWIRRSRQTRRGRSILLLPCCASSLASPCLRRFGSRRRAGRPLA